MYGRGGYWIARSSWAMTASWIESPAPVKPPLPSALQHRTAGIAGLGAQFLLDADQLIIFRHAVGASERARLDLPAIGGDGEIGDGRVLGLAGAVRHHRGIARVLGHAHGVERLRQRSDLVHLDENGVGDALLDASLQPHHISDEKIVADELAASAQGLRERPPSLPVVLGHAVLDGV